MYKIQAVILAAGLGSRLGKPYPKCLTRIPDGRTIMQQQVDNIREVLGEDANITVVVGFQAEKIVEEFPDLQFVYNDEYDQTNTSKSLLRALIAGNQKAHTLWLNGDVVFDSSILRKGLPLMRSGQSYITVDQSTVAEEEVKYTTDREGFVKNLSKVIPSHEALGEAVGINFISAQDTAILIKHLKKVNNQDYFEKGIENAIMNGELLIEPVDISGGNMNAVEVDFEEDLQKVYRIFN